jgi:hypothetical protein
LWYAESAGGKSKVVTPPGAATGTGTTWKPSLRIASTSDWIAET